MEHAGYVAAGWGLTAAAVGGYWFWIARRARRARSVLAGPTTPVVSAPGASNGASDGAARGASDGAGVPEER